MFYEEYRNDGESVVFEGNDEESEEHRIQRLVQSGFFLFVCLYYPKTEYMSLIDSEKRPTCIFNISGVRQRLMS